MSVCMYVTYVYICMCMYLYICMYVYMYVRMYIFIHIYIYIHIYTHTHTHTYIYTWHGRLPLSFRRFFRHLPACVSFILPLTGFSFLHPFILSLLRLSIIPRKRHGVQSLLRKHELFSQSNSSHIMKREGSLLRSYCSNYCPQPDECSPRPFVQQKFQYHSPRLAICT
jgi:hypothetical protein